MNGEANAKRFANKCGPGGTLGAHTTWQSPTCGVLALPQVDLPALALST